MSAAPLPVVRRAASKAAKNKEELLRNAIALYHLSPSFYPTSAKSSKGGESSSSKLDKQIDKTIRRDLFGSKAERVGDPGLRLTQPPSFATGDLLKGTVDILAGRGPKDGSNWQGPSSLAFQANKESFLESVSLDSSEVHQTRLQQLRKHFLSAREAPTMTSRPQLRPLTSEDAPLEHHIQVHSSAAVRQGGIDERTARIRDALFGTVGAGEKPGLDAVRARKGTR